MKITTKILCVCLVAVMLVLSFASCGFLEFEESVDGTGTQKKTEENSEVKTEAKIEETEENTEARIEETVEETVEEIDDKASIKVASMTNNVYEYYDEISISIYFENIFGSSVEAAVYVDAKIVGKDGTVLYEKTLTKQESQNAVKINYDDVTAGTTNIGILYYKVYTDYISFDEVSEELEKLPWTVDIEIPTTPLTVSYVSSYSGIMSSCNVTAISYKVDDDDLDIFFTGEKTYDKDGNMQSGTCYIAWKLYDEEGFVVEDGVCYTVALKVGEKFKNAESSAYDVIEQGMSYSLEILDYGF